MTAKPPVRHPDAVFPGKRGPKLTSKEALLGVCDSIAEGDTLEEACKKAELSKVTFYSALQRDEEILNAYRVSRLLRAHGFVDRSLDLVDQVLDGSITPAQCREASHNLHWAASRLGVAEFGQCVRHEVEHKPADDTVDLSNLSLEELTQYEALISKIHPQSENTDD